ncbi:MAG: PRD domain-containing protein [Pseudoclavibacter sp.]
MQTIKKVLNSSVVLVEDEHGVESIVLGKGIGYGQKAGSEVLPDPAFQVFRASSDKEQQLLVELLKQIPAEFVDLTREIVDRAESAGLEIDSRIYLSLTDHLNFATERAKSNLNVVNRLAWEMRTLYPRQYEVAEYGVRRLRELTGASIPDEEAANISFHLVNAGSKDVQFDAMRVATLVSSVVQIVTHSTSISFRQEDLGFSRFVSHLQYFAERLFTGHLLVSDDDFLYTQLSTRYPDAMRAAERVREFVYREHETSLPNEEVAYLALHIARNSKE